MAHFDCFFATLGDSKSLDPANPSQMFYLHSLAGGRSRIDRLRSRRDGSL